MRGLTNSPNSVVDESSEREAVETLLSICKSSSPSHSENSMDSSSSGDNWTSNNDMLLQPVYGPYSSQERSFCFGSSTLMDSSHASFQYTCMTEYGGLGPVLRSPVRRESKLAQVIL